MMDENDAQIVGNAVGEAFKPIIKELRARVTERERRCAELELKGVRYRGVYQRAENYRPGDLITHDGSLWAALTETRQAPASGGDWQLRAKRGRDAPQHCATALMRSKRDWRRNGRHDV